MIPNAPHCVQIGNREYFLLHTTKHKKPGWRVTPIGDRLGAIATIYPEKNGEFYIETMEFHIHGFVTAELAQQHIDHVGIPNATIGRHDDGAFRINIKHSQIHGFKSERDAVQRLHDIISP